MTNKSLNLQSCCQLLGADTASANLDLGDDLHYKKGKNDPSPEAYTFVFKSGDASKKLNVVYDPPYELGMGKSGNGTVLVWWMGRTVEHVIAKTGIDTHQIETWLCKIRPLLNPERGCFEKVGVTHTNNPPELNYDHLMDVMENSRKLSGFTDRVGRTTGLSPEYLVMGSSHQLLFTHMHTRLVLGFAEKHRDSNVWADFYPNTKDPGSRGFHASKALEARDYRGSSNKTGSLFIDTIINPFLYFQTISYVAKKVKEHYNPITQFVTNCHN